MPDKLDDQDEFARNNTTPEIRMLNRSGVITEWLRAKDFFMTKRYLTRVAYAIDRDLVLMGFLLEESIDASK